MSHQTTLFTEPPITPFPDRSSESKPLILVVEADDDTRALYRQSLELGGYDVVEATDGPDAIAKALVQPPTLVVTETRLPLVDGYELCQILRRDKATTDLPILVVTAEARPAEVEHARQAGADAVLVKPARIDDVLDEMRRLVTDLRNGCVRADPATANAIAPDELPARSEQHRTVLAKSHSRFSTTTPPASPPSLTCPSCDRPLEYERSHIGGVSERHSEQWDYYACAGSCGTFQYRQRTRKVRRLGDDEQRWLKAVPRPS